MAHRTALSTLSASLTRYVLCAAMAVVLSVPAAALPKSAAQNAAAAYKNSCSGKDIAAVISETKKKTANMASDAQKKELLIFLAECQEHVSQYDDAAKSWYDAAFADQKGIRDDTCLIYATICAMNCGDYKTAEGYLNPIILTATDQNVLADARITSAWLSAATGNQQQAVTLLTAYADSSDPAMRQKRPAVLFSLWYITDTDSYRNILQKEFPQSPEARIAAGKAQLVPGTFWYFMMRTATAALKPPETEPQKTQPKTAEKETEVTSAAPDAATPPTTDNTETFWQTGFYKNQEYADAMVKKLKDAGFVPVVKKQTRSSGTEYFAVGVMENKDGTIAPSLRNAGIECSPVFKK